MANEEFLQKCESAFRHLFDAAKAKNELHFAMALIPEQRGMLEADWNSAAETDRAFRGYLEFLQTIDDGPMKCRIVLGFYCHLAEASGFYEIPKNMLRIAGGEQHKLWPFKHLVEAHKLAGEKIAPNANKVFKDLLGHAQQLGMHELVEVFKEAFDSDVRNGYSHADYVVAKNGIHLTKRNGGSRRSVEWKEFNDIVQRGIHFYEILRAVSAEHGRSYNPPKTIRGQMGNERPSDWTISYEPKTGAFRIGSGGGPAT